MTIRSTLLGALSLLLVPVVAVAQTDNRAFTKEFPIDECQFTLAGSNPYFSLKPGTQLHFSNDRCVAAGKCDVEEEAVITVLNQTKVITLRDDGKSRNITTRVIKEIANEDGELKEVSFNYFAECKGTQDVYYFGEDVDVFDNGQVTHPGAWLAGQKKAEPGIIIAGGAFLIGARYFNEIAPDVALDRVEHVAEDLKVNVPAGRFDDCVRVKETTPLEPGASTLKTYCPGVGLAVDDDLELEGFFGN